MAWVGFGLAAVPVLGFLGEEVAGGFAGVGGRSAVVVGGFGVVVVGGIGVVAGVAEGAVVAVVVAEEEEGRQSEVVDEQTGWIAELG